MPRIVASTGNRRNVYDATPIFRPRQGLEPDAADGGLASAAERSKGAAAMVVACWRNARRLELLRFISWKINNAARPKAIWRVQGAAGIHRDAQDGQDSNTRNNPLSELI